MSPLFVVFTLLIYFLFFFFSSRRRHTRFDCDWSSDVCSSDLILTQPGTNQLHGELDVYGDHSALNAANPFAANQPTYYADGFGGQLTGSMRSEERRVGKECRSRGAPDQ